MSYKIIINSGQFDYNVWSSFVVEHKRGNVFQTPQMAKVYARSKKHETVFIAILNQANELEGLLLAVIIKEHSGFLGRFTARAIIWGGPLVKDNNLEVLSLILREYNKLVKGKAIYSQFRNLWKWSDEEAQVFSDNGFKAEAHLDILVKLDQHPAEILMAMHKGRRKNIRRAERLPLVFREAAGQEEEDKCIRIIKSTYKKIKLPSPDPSFFHQASRRLNGQATLKKFIVTFNDDIIACRFVLCYKQMIYDWYAGAIENHLDKYPNDYLPWKIIEWGTQNGYTVFDFGGAGKPGVSYGVRDYKLKFGGEVITLDRLKIIYNPILFFLGRLLINVYKKIR